MKKVKGKEGGREGGREGAFGAMILSTYYYLTLCMMPLVQLVN